MKLRTLFSGLLLGAAALSSTGCITMKSVGTGEVLFVVPQYGDKAGVENAQILGTGRRFHPVTKKSFLFETSLQTHSFTSNLEEGAIGKDQAITFLVDGNEVSMDVAATIRFKQDPVPGADPGYTLLHKYFAAYNKPADIFIEGEFYNSLRDCYAQVVQEADISTTDFARAYTAFTGDVQKCLDGTYDFLDVTNVSALSAPRLPVHIADQKRQEDEAVNASRVARQQAETAATQNKILVDEAKAQAEANRILSESLTSNLIEQQWIKKWDGREATIVQSANTQVSNTQNEE